MSWRKKPDKYLLVEIFPLLTEDEDRYYFILPGLNRRTEFVELLTPFYILFIKIISCCLSLLTLRTLYPREESLVHSKCWRGRKTDLQVRLCTSSLTPAVRLVFPEWLDSFVRPYIPQTPPICDVPFLRSLDFSLWEVRNDLWFSIYTPVLRYSDSFFVETLTLDLSRVVSVSQS